AILGTRVVSTAPVSRTSRTSACPLGPTTTASTKIRSPSSSNDVSDLIRHLDAREPQFAPAGVGIGDHGIVAPRALVEGVFERSMVADQLCRSNRPAGLMLDVDKTDPLVPVPSADLHPG